MSHSRMLATRRKKQRTRKDFAGTAKRAKKLTQKGVKPAGADAAKKASA